MQKFLSGVLVLFLLSSSVNAQESKSGSNKQIPSAFPKYKLKGHKNIVCSMAFSPDGKILASGSFDSTIRLWDVQGGELMKILSDQKMDWGIRSVSFTPDGKKLIIATDDSENPAWVWDVATGKGEMLIKKKLTPTFSGWSTAVSPDGKTVIIGASRQYKFFDLSRMKEIKHVEIERWSRSNFVYCLDYSPDGKMLAVGLGDGTKGELVVWNLKNNKRRILLKAPEKAINSVEFTSDGDYLVAALNDGRVEIWTCGTDFVHRESLRDFKAPVKSAALSPDDRFLFTGGGRWNEPKLTEVKLWNLRTSKVIATFEGNKKFVVAVAYSPDGKYVAAGGRDNNVMIWNVKEITDKIKAMTKN